MTRTVAAWLRAYANWMRRLPQATGMMFAARSTWGRSVKIGLFGVGVVLPLGSLIWLVLFWHGNGLGQRKTLVAPMDESKPALPAPTSDA